MSKPRRGHPLVESVIVQSAGYDLIVVDLLKIGNCRIRAYLCMHIMHERVDHVKCARYDPWLGYPGAPPYIP